MITKETTTYLSVDNTKTFQMIIFRIEKILWKNNRECRTIENYRENDYNLEEGKL